MKILKVLLFTLLLLPFAGYSNAGQKHSAPLTLQHQLSVTINPETSELKIRDVVTLPDNGQSAFKIHLNSRFHLRYKKRPLHPVESDDKTSSYHLAVGASRQIVLNYKGSLDSTPDCAWLKQSCVMLNDSGVFLDGNSQWYPHITGALHQFRMDVKLPPKWVSLSQGAQTDKGWQEGQPQRAIYLVAGPFQVYESQPDPAKPKAMVYLQQKAPQLAQRYLQATHQYLEQYSRMLGDYPYAKFATVESFWETGWGMPSFTLLGSRVMRLPFILHSAFPHEILHNWWGNSVYVDSAAGNWSEGLTAYLADHHNKASKAERVAYRRNTLQKYRAYTTAGSDFPLRDFHSRHDRITQAVGYSKALMLFHMLRKRLGDQRFFNALRVFNQRHRFSFASFIDLQQAFMDSSKLPLDNFFQQWRDRTGAPELAIGDYQVSSSTGAANTSDAPFTLTLTLQQKQPGQPFAFDIPLKVQDTNGNFNYQTLSMTKTEQTYTLSFKSPVQRLFVDPAFDLLRTPDKREVPLALNTLFNRQAKTFILPSQAPQPMQRAWQAFIAAFSYGQSNMLIQYDDAGMPDSDVVIILGADNKLLPNLLQQTDQPFTSKKTTYLLNNTHYSQAQHSLALTFQSGIQQIILLSAITPEALKVLTRKLPHYGKYSYVLFNNSAAKNIAKGQWQITQSPMVIQLNN